MGNVYIKFTDDNSDSLTQYGVKGMKWHKRLKSKIQDELASRLEDRLLGREREFETKYAAYGSSSKVERSIAKTALKARDESKRRKTLKYKISNSVLNTKKNAISKGKGVYDKLRNKNKSPNRESFDKAVTAAKKGYISKTVKSAADNAGDHQGKYIVYKTNTHKQTGTRGTKKNITTYRTNVHYKGPKGLAELAKDSRTNKKEKRKRSKYSRG